MPIKSTDLLNNITVINFWFTGCQPCIAEMPELNYLVDAYKGQPVNFVAFTFNDAESVKNFIQKHDFKYLQVPDARTLIKELGINSYPTHLVDSKGIVRSMELGARVDIYDALDKEIVRLKQ